jgi:hypothetical protein
MYTTTMLVKEVNYECPELELELELDGKGRTRGARQAVAFMKTLDRFLKT